MFSIGKAIRVERIFNRDTGRTIIVPMDHGVSVGPIAGLVDMKTAVGQVVDGGVNAVLMHKGMVDAGHRGGGKDVGLIVHLSASTSLSPTPNSKVLVASVEDALKLGADAVSIHVNLGDQNEGHMLQCLGETASKASFWGMPLLAMMYARGHDTEKVNDADAIAHCARVGAELGADIVKVSYTGDVESFTRVVKGCGVPVVIAGGPRMGTSREILQMVHDSIEAGGSGLSIGRNIFQDKDPAKLLKALAAIVHQEMDVDSALELMN